MPKPRKRILTPCYVCGTINSVRKDFLQSLPYPYRCGHCAPKWKPESLEDRIRIGLIHRIYSVNDNFFEKIDTEIKAYWLGFLAGDGTISGNKVRLCLNLKDREHLQLFKRTVGWTGRDYLHHNNALEVRFSSLKMVTDLANYSITPRKTFTVNFPKIHKSFEPHFIRGLFDADGCISKVKRERIGKSGQKYICYGGAFSIQGNKQFMLVLRDKFMVLGLPQTSINYSGKTINRVRYGGINQLKIIYNYMYKDATVFLSRKKNLFEDILENYHYEIIN